MVDDVITDISKIICTRSFPCFSKCQKLNMVILLLLTAYISILLTHKNACFGYNVNFRLSKTSGNDNVGRLKRKLIKTGKDHLDLQYGKRGSER